MVLKHCFKTLNETCEDKRKSYSLNNRDIEYIVLVSKVVIYGKIQKHFFAYYKKHKMNSY